MNKLSQNKGFIALISVIILTSVLLLVAYELSTSGFLSSISGVDIMSKELSYAMAFSCADQALFTLSEDLDYEGNETKTIDEYSCSIGPVVLAGTDTIVQTIATVAGKTTRLRIVLDEFLVIEKFEEL